MLGSEREWPMPVDEDLAVLSRRCRWVERAARVAAAIAVPPGMFVGALIAMPLYVILGRLLGTDALAARILTAAVYLIGPFGLGLGAWWAARRFGLHYLAIKVMERRECFGCGYSLVGLPVNEGRVRCPECGYASLVVGELPAGGL